MSNGSYVTLKDLDQRLAIVRDNIRQLIEQAAGFSGAGDEDRNATRIAEQQAELDRLNKEREVLAKAERTPEPRTKPKKPKAAKRRAAQKKRKPATTKSAQKKKTQKKTKQAARKTPKKKK
jgi:hypothetical protein